MLFKRPVLEAIRAGKIDRAYRCWRKPAAKAGGTLKTAVGVLRIVAVDRVHADEITERDARLAGAAGRVELLRELAGRTGDLHRIKLAFGGEDPRIALRAASLLPADDVARLREKLTRLDRSSPCGPWTSEVMRTIAGHPRERAASLAVRLNREKEWLKLNIRKLKNLGLTISHETGYEISPRGRALLRALSTTQD